MENFNDEILKSLADKLIEDGWFGGYTYPSQLEYVIQTDPKREERSWQRLKDRLQREGVWRYE